MICKQCFTVGRKISGRSPRVVTLSKNTVMLSEAGRSVSELKCVRTMATKVRTAEERKSRQVSRADKMESHEKFPFLPTKPTRQVYILDNALADEIAQLVTKHREDPSAPVLEINPGPGVLTDALLKAGVKHVLLAEALRGFLPYAENLKKRHKKKIMEIFHWDFWSVRHRMADSDFGYKDCEEKIIALLPHKPWLEGPPLTVVGVTPEQKDRSLLLYLLMSCARQHGLFMLGRPEWFLIISPSIYRNLVTVKDYANRTSKHYSRLAIVFHLVFDIHFCAELPSWKFTPSFPEKRSQKQDQIVTASSRYMVRVRPHAEPDLPLSQVPAFFAFLSQIMKKRKQRLIPKMEQLMPGCGIHLIMSGFSMLELIVDVSPQQFISIFKAMQSWPEFEGSPLKQHLEDNTILDTEALVEDENVSAEDKQD